MVTYYLCWQCAGLCRVIWAIYSPRYKNKEMTNKYAEGAHCFPLARLPKLFTDLSSAGPKPALNRLSLSAHALTQVNLWPQHLVFLSFKLREQATIEIEHSRHSVPCSHGHLFPSFVQSLSIPHSREVYCALQSGCYNAQNSKGLLMRRFTDGPSASGTGLCFLTCN